MRNFISIVVTATGFLFITIMLLNSATAQPGVKVGDETSLIPGNIMKIAEKSCVACHSVPGNDMAIAKLNLTDWDKLTSDKQASKAQAMCIMISKDKMPPREFRADHPESALTTDDIKAMYAWAQSLQNAKK